MKKKTQENSLRVAVVCDPLYKWGGAEAHMKVVLETFNCDEVYTAYCDKEFVKEKFPNIKVRTSFMQYLPWKVQLKYLYLLLQPLAYKSLRLGSYDAVVSISIIFAKFAKGKKHINLCLTPPKFLWQKEDRTLKEIEQLKGLNRIFFKIYTFFMDTILEDIWKSWDQRAALKVDGMVANSKVVQRRIKKFYGRDSDVIYPPVDVKDIVKDSKVGRKENWFLYLGRVETYKGVDLAIRAAVEAKVPLKVAGKGDDMDRMKDLIRDLNGKGCIKMLGFVSDEEKVELLSRAKALIFPVRGEDFGITPVEANAAGTPVIAYKDGGVVETISDVNPKTGIFFDKYDYKSLAKILKTFDGRSYKADNCVKQSENFATEIFKYKLNRYVQDIVQNS